MSLDATLEVLDNVAVRLASRLADIIGKEPEQMSDEEQVAIAIASGVPWEFTGTGMRVTVPFAIVKSEGRYTVCYKAKP